MWIVMQIRQWQWQWQWINFIAMHYIKNTEFHAESFTIIGTIWDIVHQSHTWQKGLEAKAYVPQYLLYNVIWKGARKKQTNKTMVQVLLFAIHLCLVTNKQFCVNNFWSEIVFIYIHTYIKCFHKLYMYTERKTERKSHHSGETPPATLEFVR